MPTILIIDDDPVIRDLFRYHFTSWSWSVSEAPSGGTGLETAEKVMPDVILLDMKMPDKDGLAVLRELKQRGCTSSVIVMTGWGSIDNAVEAVKLGAEQYVPKPVDIHELYRLVNRVFETRKLRMENTFYREQADDNLVGVSMEIQKLHHLIDLMAENVDTTTLLLGESGTGKELIARQIHSRSLRRERPFLDINCAVLSETLLESEMFGHERGAFTDARERKRGLLEVAGGGTVLLDEVGEMPLNVQPKLLRMLESKTFRRLGGTVDIPINVRIIAATNRDLDRAVSEGRFRQDLYYRLYVFPIHIPALRERTADIPVLADHFLNLFNRVLKKNVTGFSVSALNLMKAYSWPGNVRELKNMVERAMVLSKGNVIDTKLLPRELAGRYPGAREDGETLPKSNGGTRTLSEMERLYILSVLHDVQQNRTAAARLLGISRSTLHEKLKRYGIA